MERLNTMTITDRKTYAEQLVQQLRQGLLATQDALQKIIDWKAWEPLGYSSFRELWDDRLADIELTGVMRATVVYAMFSEGANDEQVATTVKGVGGKTVTALRQAHQYGLTPKQGSIHAARTQVRPHTRKLPTKRNGVYLEGFTDTEIKRWNDLAEDLGVDRNDMLREALREAMDAMVGEYADN